MNDFIKSSYFYHIYCRLNTIFNKKKDRKIGLYYRLIFLSNIPKDYVRTLLIDTRLVEI